MKIGYFVTHYPYEKEYGDYFCGGVGEVAESLAKEMARRGHDVSVFTTSRTKSFEIEEKENLSIYRYAPNFAVENARISLRLLIEPLKYDLDVVHTHMGNAPSPMAAQIYSKLRRKPLVTTYHGDQQSSYGSLLRRLLVGVHNKCFASSVLNASKSITCPSEPFIYESRFLCNFASNVQIIPNGLNFEKMAVQKSKEECRIDLNIPADKTVFLFVGSLSKYKGPDILLMAMKHVNEKNKDAMLIYVGNGGMCGELRQMCKNLELDHIVKFAGFVSAEDRNKYFKASDIFILPSTLNTEVFPIVLLEASAFGLPIVVSSLKTFNCLVENGKNGLITKRNDPEDLARVLLLLSKDDPMRKELSRNAYLKTKDFTWSKIADEFEKIYEALT